MRRCPGLRRVAVRAATEEKNAADDFSQQATEAVNKAVDYLKVCTVGSSCGIAGAVWAVGRLGPMRAVERATCQPPPLCFEQRRTSGRGPLMLRSPLPLRSS